MDDSNDGVRLLHVSPVEKPLRSTRGSIGLVDMTFLDPSVTNLRTIITKVVDEQEKSLKWTISGFDQLNKWTGKMFIEMHEHLDKMVLFLSISIIMTFIVAFIALILAVR